MTYMPHGMCYLWQTPLLLAHVIADGLCAVAYFFIAVFLVWLVRQREDIPFSWALVAFAAFIVSCGATHVMSIVVIWHPAYWAEAAVKWVTAVASVGTAAALLPLAPKLLGLRSAAELARLNAERNAAVEASVLKSRFVATVSHELRTPLNGIMGMSELLQQMLPVGKAFEYTATIRRSADILLHLVEDLLTFSRAEAGQIQLEDEAFSVAACVTSAVDVFREEARRRGIALTEVTAPDIPLVRGDRMRVEQVITNFLSNAMRFTHEGFVRVEARAIAANGGEATVRFSVEDSGIGIPPHALERIFEPFHQVDSSNARRFGGSGLGLSIVRHLATIMGGEVGVESREHSGSTFTFTVRLKRAEASS